MCVPPPIEERFTDWNHRSEGTGGSKIGKIPSINIFQHFCISFPMRCGGGPLRSSIPSTCLHVIDPSCQQPHRCATDVCTCSSFSSVDVSPLLRGSVRCIHTPSLQVSPWPFPSRKFLCVFDVGRPCSPAAPRHCGLGNAIEIYILGTMVPLQVFPPNPRGGVRHWPSRGR